MLRPSCRSGSSLVACSFWGRKNVFTQPGSKPEKLSESKCFPLFTQQRTSPRYFGMSVSCHEWTRQRADHHVHRSAPVPGVGLRPVGEVAIELGKKCHAVGKPQFEACRAESFKSIPWRAAPTSETNRVVDDNGRAIGRPSAGRRD